MQNADRLQENFQTASDFLQTMRDAARERTS
jgi:hypothetical protein